MMVWGVVYGRWGPGDTLHGLPVGHGQTPQSEYKMPCLETLMLELSPDVPERAQ
jgi:hypothetical protein